MIFGIEGPYTSGSQPFETQGPPGNFESWSLTPLRLGHRLIKEL